MLNFFRNDEDELENRDQISETIALWAFMLAPAISMALTYAAISIIQPRSQRTIACSWAVETALNTSSMLELQRADYLTRHLRCKVGRRLSDNKLARLAQHSGGVP